MNSYLSTEQTQDVRAAVMYYMQRNISIKSPRYNEYEAILLLLSKSKEERPMTVTTEDGGRQNLFAKEPKMYTTEVTVTHNEKAEMLNGRAAMIGIIAAFGAYAITGQIIPGIW